MSTTSNTTGLAGADTINGTSNGDKLNGGARNDTINGMAGNDFLNSGAGDDVLDGGSGSDTVSGDAGNDVLVYVAAENKNATVSSSDTYDGGSGVDTLRLVLTRAEWMNPTLQLDVAKYLAFITANTGANGSAKNTDFTFSTFGLTAGKIEKLEVIVDGVSIDPANHTVTLGNDVVTTSENAASVAVDVLANDAVPDLIKTLIQTRCMAPSSLPWRIAIQRQYRAPSLFTPPPPAITITWLLVKPAATALPIPSPMLAAT
jgi:hypothetical protein